MFSLSTRTFSSFLQICCLVQPILLHRVIVSQVYFLCRSRHRWSAHTPGCWFDDSPALQHMNRFFLSQFGVTDNVLLPVMEAVSKVLNCVNPITNNTWTTPLAAICPAAPKPLGTTSCPWSSQFSTSLPRPQLGKDTAAGCGSILAKYTLNPK